MSDRIIEVYTDGSCHSQLKIGGWAAILLMNDEKTILKDVVFDTTHNRMELLAVIEAINYINTHLGTFEKINIYSDSQYVVNLADRKESLKANHFRTKKGTPVQNAELVKTLIVQTESNPVSFTKVAAHQKATNIINYNREADKIARKIVREQVTKHDHEK